MRLGQDVEMFLQDSNGKHISAIGYINAGKLDPMQIPGMAQGFTLQEDNVALEYGMPPAASMQEWNDSIVAVMEASKAYLPGLSFSGLACTVFDADQLQHPLSFVFGCEPDYNAWTGLKNPRPKPPHPNMRSAGGHIHVETEEHPFEVVQAMDLFLGVVATLVDPDNQRKQIYGKAGACRPKKYGVEYRTLSNYWAFTQERREWVWRSTERALGNLGVAATVQPLILEAINNGDKDVAEELVKMFDLEVV